MGRVWVLDTETKGTGAQMVPLEKVQRKAQPSAAPFFVPPKPKPREPKPDEPPAPRRFKVIDVATRAVVAEDASARETVQALQDVRSSVDVSVSVWEPDEARWRLLTLAEQKKLWDLRSRVPAAARR
jgi:hypothetical protein